MKKKKRVLLLVPPNKEGYIRDTYYGCWHKKKFVDYSWPPLYLCQLAAIIPGSEMLDLSAKEWDIESSLYEIIKKDPDIIVCNIGTFTFKDDLFFLERLKNKFPLKIIAFGQHPTVCPEDTLKRGIVDIAIKGEPEDIICSVIDNIRDRQKLRKIDGVCYKGYNSSKKAQIKSLDSLPFPSRTIKHTYFNPLAKEFPYTTMLISRGCPFDCTFCTVPTLYGKELRKRSIENVISEIKMILSAGYKEIFFRDENLTLDRNYLLRLCRAIKDNNINFKWMSNSRVDTVNFELLTEMKNAGCHLLKFGVESSSQRILDTLKKGTNIEEINNAFSMCRELGIETVGHFMIGSPGETREDILKTIWFAIELEPTYASFDVLIEYPGAEISKAKKCKLTPEELESLHNLAFRKFYLRPSKIIQQALSVRNCSQLKNKIISTAQLWKGLYKAGN